MHPDRKRANFSQLSEYYKQYKFNALKDENNKQEAMNGLERQPLENHANTDTNINDLWTSTKKILQKVTENEIGYNRKQFKKPWMTEEVYNMINERRAAKATNNKNKYTKLTKICTEKL